MEKIKNKGYLYPNSKKSSKSPNYKGTINIGEATYDISAWIKTAKKDGTKYLSLAINFILPKITKSKQIVSKPKKYYSAQEKKDLLKKISKLEQEQRLKQKIKHYPTGRKNLPTPKNPSINQNDIGKVNVNPHAKFIKEPLGSREDYKKDRARTGGETRYTNRVIPREDK